MHGPGDNRVREAPWSPWVGVSWGKLLGGAQRLSWKARGRKGKKERKEKITGVEKAGLEKKRRSADANEGAAEGAAASNHTGRRQQEAGTEHRASGAGCWARKGHGAHPTIRLVSCHC